jgi:hypothetical protein
MISHRNDKRTTKLSQCVAQIEYQTVVKSKPTTAVIGIISDGPLLAKARYNLITRTKIKEFLYRRVYCST